MMSSDEGGLESAGQRDPGGGILTPRRLEQLENHGRVIFSPIFRLSDGVKAYFAFPQVDGAKEISKLHRPGTRRNFG